MECKNQNIDKIEERINTLFFENAGLVEQDATYLSNARHISLIEKAVESLQAVNEGLELGMPVDLLQVDFSEDFPSTCQINLKQINWHS